jgi:hypothetical protein
VHTKRKPIFGILALAAGILLVMLEVTNYRRSGEVSAFWLLVAALGAALGLYDIISRSRQP